MAIINEQVEQVNVPRRRKDPGLTRLWAKAYLALRRASRRPYQATQEELEKYQTYPTEWGIKPIGAFPGHPVIAVARESPVDGQDLDTQARLENQQDRLRKALEGRNPIVMEYAVKSGGRTARHLGQILDLVDDYEAAHGVRPIVVSETIERLLRPAFYDPQTNPNAPYLRTDFMPHRFIFQRAQFCTIVHPDALPRENHGYKIKRGQLAKGNSGGKPVVKRKARKAKFQPLAIKLRQQGWSFADIAEEITRQNGGHRVVKKTIINWVN